MCVPHLRCESHNQSICFISALKVYVCLTQHNNCHNIGRNIPRFGCVTLYVCVHDTQKDVALSHHGTLPWIAGIEVWLPYCRCFGHIFGATICVCMCVTRCPTTALRTAHMSWSRTASSDDRCNVNILPPEHSHAYIPASRSLFFVFHPESRSQNIPSPTMVCLLLVIPKNCNFFLQIRTQFFHTENVQ